MSFVLKQDVSFSKFSGDFLQIVGISVVDDVQNYAIQPAMRLCGFQFLVLVLISSIGLEKQTITKN